mmetsp:Transcript_45658/g.108539  ORF Transcript_45658/g.108539 Transcript_45658/m.108539 type:complete len:233 (+) Transcript_45658:1726-2424(+)
MRCRSATASSVRRMWNSFLSFLDIFSKACCSFSLAASGPRLRRRTRSMLMTMLKLCPCTAVAQNLSGPGRALALTLALSALLSISKNRWRNSGGASRHTFTTCTESANALPSTCGQAENSRRTQRATKKPGTTQGLSAEMVSSCFEICSQLSPPTSDLPARSFTSTLCLACAREGAAWKTKVSASVDSSWSFASAAMGASSRKVPSPSPPASNCSASPNCTPASQAGPPSRT